MTALFDTLAVIGAGCIICTGSLLWFMIFDEYRFNKERRRPTPREVPDLHKSDVVRAAEAHVRLMRKRLDD